MKTLFLLLTSLTFASVRATVDANPRAVVDNVAVAARSLDPCCPEWLCRLLCSWCCPPSQRAECTPPSCCGSSCQGD